MKNYSMCTVERGHVACIGERRGIYKVLVGKPEGKSPLGRPGQRWEDNIEGSSGSGMGECMDWIELA